MKPLCASAPIPFTAGEIADSTRSLLLSVARNVSQREDALIGDTLAAAVVRARHAAKHWAFEAPSTVVEGWIVSLFPGYRDEELNRIRVAVLARLALEHSDVQDRLPVSVLCLYPGFFERLARFLANATTRSYKPDYYFKDVRYALGLTVPCGLQQIDLSYRIGPRLILREIAHSRLARLGWDYLWFSAWGRWYNTHLDPREMSEFGEAGWTASFCRIAEMLELNPHLCGAAGVSWFYDPAVGEISPELAYLRQNQMKNGGFSLRLGEAPQHTKNALYASRKRQQLYSEGTYKPAGFLVAWPRQALIAWARSRARP
jgi:hypothetical protein